jgi:hypothetical protein
MPKYCIKTKHGKDFRRCGRKWTKDCTEVADNEFTAAQMAALKAEPLLVVEELPVPELELEPSRGKTQSRDRKGAGKDK